MPVTAAVTDGLTDTARPSSPGSSAQGTIAAEPGGRHHDGAVIDEGQQRIDDEPATRPSPDRRDMSATVRSAGRMR